MKCFAILCVLFLASGAAVAHTPDARDLTILENCAKCLMTNDAIACGARPSEYKASCANYLKKLIPKLPTGLTDDYKKCVVAGLSAKKAILGAAPLLQSDKDVVIRSCFEIEGKKYYKIGGLGGLIAAILHLVANLLNGLLGGLGLGPGYFLSHLFGDNGLVGGLLGPHGLIGGLLDGLTGNDGLLGNLLHGLLQ